MGQILYTIYGQFLGVQHLTAIECQRIICMCQRERIEYVLPVFFALVFHHETGVILNYKTQFRENYMFDRECSEKQMIYH